MKKLLIVGFSSAFILAGCGGGVPKCGDSETKKLVSEIADEEMASQIGRAAANKFTYSLEAIRTTDVHDKTGAFECAAELAIHASNGGKNSIPITYTVEKTDDKKQFYVQVYGL